MQGLSRILHRNFLSKSQIHTRVRVNPAMFFIIRIFVTAQSAVRRLTEQSGKATLDILNLSRITKL